MVRPFNPAGYLLECAQQEQVTRAQYVPDSVEHNWPVIQNKKNLFNILRLNCDPSIR